MGKKRKHEKTEEEIQRKIQKLQKQLRIRRNLQTSTSSEDLNSESSSYIRLSPENLDAVTAVSLHSGSPTPADNNDDQLYVPSPNPASPSAYTQGAYTPRAASPPAAPQQSPIPGTSTEAIQPGAAEEHNLEEDILQLLGDAPKTDSPMGPPIHKDVANRWQDILAKGLAKDVKDNLLKNYLVPTNCDLLLSPALNLEVKAALQDTLVKRDSSLMYKQKQLGIALSALASATELILSNETSKQKLLKPISDACRILCDSHYMVTKTRRNFIISSINSKVRDALLEAQRGKLLFGDNVAEKLKAAKNIQQSGNALKNTQRPKITRNNTVSKPGPSKGRLNFTPLHRKTDNKSSDTSRVLRPTQRAPQASSRSRRPSPPPRATTHRR